MLREGLTISGRIEFAGSAERPIQQRLMQIPITAEPADGQQRTNATLNSRVEANGTFKITGLLPGRYLIRTNSPPGWTHHSSMAHGMDVADVPLDLTEKDGSGVIVRFTDRLSQLSGTVRGVKDQDDAPAVVVFPADIQLWKNYGFNPRRMRMTRAFPSDGTYTRSRRCRPARTTPSRFPRNSAPSGRTRRISKRWRASRHACRSRTARSARKISRFRR